MLQTYKVLREARTPQHISPARQLGRKKRWEEEERSEKTLAQHHKTQSERLNDSAVQVQGLVGCIEISNPNSRWWGR